MNKFLTLPMIAGALIVPNFAGAQSDDITIAKIINEGKNHSQVMDLLRQITDIGPRLTTSTNLERAEAWAAAKLKSFGCTNVHLEQWGEWDLGFDRGPATGRMIAPYDLPLTFTFPAWGAGTNGPVRGHVVRMPQTFAEFEKNKDQIRGAWLFTSRAPARRPQGAAAPAPTPADDDAEKLSKAIAESDYLGRVIGSRNELVITSGNPRGKTIDNLPKEVVVTITRSDAERIDRNLDFGRKVELKFNLPVKFRKGPIKLYNVVGEIKGTEKPDEVVIVSGHIDSWDGPGSQGALDNGTGTCTALEAARILNKIGAKPKRTIRFILWSGEEQGLFGSREYVKQHEAEMAKVQAVLVDDGGTNYQGGYTGPEIYKAAMEAAFAPVVAAFPEFPQKYNVVKAINNQGGGSDHAPFWTYGIPSFFTNETGRSDYNFVHHTQHDRYEMAIPEYLVQSGTNHAVVAYTLANLPELLPHVVPPARQPRPTATPAPSGTGTGRGGQ